MDEFGRLPNDVLSVIHSMYLAKLATPDIDVIKEGESIFLVIIYPSHTIKLGMYNTIVSVNYYHLCNLFNIIYYKYGCWVWDSGSISIGDNIKIMKHGDIFTISLNSLDVFISVLIKYFKLISDCTIVCGIYDEDKRLYHIEHTKLIVDNEFNLIGHLNKITNNMEGINEEDTKIYNTLKQFRK